MSFIKVSAETLETLGPAKGAYVLALHLGAQTDVIFRPAQKETLPSGWYFYVGSANGPGGIRARLRRHFRQNKKIHWHIDRLTTKADHMHAFAVPGGKECAIADRLLASKQFTSILPGFGSTDCGHCKSHLLAPTGLIPAEGLAQLPL